jgi:branched-chain amino acid transport system permease protein
MSFDALVQAVLDGVLTGGIYALMAAGLTLIFGVMDIINIAQGAMVITGAYLSFWLQTKFAIDPFLGLLITIPAMFVLGVVFEYGFLRRVGDRDRTSMSILMSYAFAIILEGLLTLGFGTDFDSISAPYVNSSVHILNFYVPDIDIFGFLLALASMGAIYAVLYRTKFGAGLRAALQNRTAADLIGVDVNRTRTIAVGIAVAVSAGGGMIYGATTPFYPDSGYDLISRLLAIVILGGLGSIIGAMASAMILLVIADIVAVAWEPTWSILVFYAVIILVLLFRPQGLFGQRAVRAQ